MTVTEGRREDIVSIWAVGVGAQLSDADYAIAAAHPDVGRLAQFSDTQLRASLDRAVASVGSRPSWQQWLDVLTQVQRLQDGLRGQRGAVRVDGALAVRVRATELVAARRARYSADTATVPFDEDVVFAAFDVLAARIGEAAATRHLLRRRASRWRVAPSRQLAGAPVVETTDIELAIVAILSATANPWQFSSTPDARMFTGSKLGYHRENERTYVAGLSDVLDTSAGAIETHRAGLGGRVYLHGNVVECADCKLVIAWLGTAGGRAAAFGRCVTAKARGKALRVVS